LIGSLRVNPWNDTELAAACARALSMAEHEKKERLESNLLYASENSPVDWFEDFITDLRRAQKKECMRVEHIGFGTKLRAVVVNESFKKLDPYEVSKSYSMAKNRIFFFDNEGTLATDVRHVYREYGAPKGEVSDLKCHGAAPNEQVLKCLRSLCMDSRNTVVILSGRNREMLEEWFGSVQRIGLAAERGFFWKLPHVTGEQWTCAVQEVDNTWKTYAFEIMRHFVNRTQGSFIENKGSALVWQYRDADQHFGSWQAKELSSHLKELLFGFDVDVTDGNGYVEVSVRGVNKGIAVNALLGKVTQVLGTVDFVLCIGDDRSDEAMFEELNKLVDPSEAEASMDDTSQLSTTDGESHYDTDRGADAGRQALDLGKDVPCGPLVERLSDPMGKQVEKTASALGSMKKRDKSSVNLGGKSSGNLCSLAGADEFMPIASSQRRFFTCTVGRKPSVAKFYLEDTDEVSELLATLESEKKRLSVKDMPPSRHTWSSPCI